jgi:hypothetical protein
VPDASAEEEARAVRVSGPLVETRLFEACLELFRTDVVVGIQAMGAAGLTRSSVEMASRAGNGLDLYVDLVPRREEGMTPCEVLPPSPRIACCSSLPGATRRRCAASARGAISRWWRWGS